MLHLILTAERLKYEGTLTLSLVAATTLPLLFVELNQNFHMEMANKLTNIFFFNLKTMYFQKNYTFLETMSM